MKIRTIFLSTIAAMFCVSLQAAERAAEKIAPAKAAWAGPQIETKTKAAVAATALTKKTDLVRALEVMYGAEVDEQEQRLKPAVFGGVKVDETTQTCEKTTYTPQPLPKPLVKIISDYVPEFHYFTPARTFAVPRLAPAHNTPSGTCASFIDKDGKRTYVAPCDKKDGADFTLCNEKGERVGWPDQGIKRLAKVAIVPCEIDEERAYTIVSCSEGDKDIKFWNQDGSQVDIIHAGAEVADFDIIPGASINDQKGDLVAVAFKGEARIHVYHILSPSYRKSRRYTLDGWSDFGAIYVRLVQTDRGCKVVTYEKDFDAASDKRSALCWYDLASGIREFRYMSPDGITGMEFVRYSKNSSALLVSDTQGVVRGYSIPYATVIRDLNLKARGFLEKSFGKKIGAIKTYNDVLDDGCPHVVVQTDDNALYDFNIRTKESQTIISPSKNKHYMGLGSDTKGRTTLLTCADGVVCEWEKDTDPFNSLYEKPIKEPKQIRVTPQVSDASAGNPASCTCIVM